VKDLQKGLSISIFIHFLLIGAVWIAWVDKPSQLKTIALDFSIINFKTDKKDVTENLNGGRHSGYAAIRNENNKTEKLNTTKDDTKIRTNEAPITPKEILSDKDGQVEVVGKEGSIFGSEEPKIGNASLAGTGQLFGGGQDGNSEGRTIRYGSGSANEKIFSYVREGILKNVRYPEKARRKGLQGKITLSFMVTEAGLTRDIKVINGSGFSELDNSAKEAIKLTTFTQRIPYKLFVILPVEYRLE
jgi:TonB family protein